MAETPTKTQSPPREPLPAVYPIALIDTAARALGELRQFASGGHGLTIAPESRETVARIAELAIDIIGHGLASHRIAVTEGRSRG